MSLLDEIRAELLEADSKMGAPDDLFAEISDHIDRALDLLDDLAPIAESAASLGETQRQLRVSHAHRAHLRGVLRDIAQAQTVEMARRRAEQAIGSEPPVSLIEREELGRVACEAWWRWWIEHEDPEDTPIPWDEESPHSREGHMQVAEAVARYVRDVDAAAREGAR
jgi:hypothetical protein